MYQQSLKILMLEDDENDKEIICQLIKTSFEDNPNILWVTNKKDFANALIDFQPDLILSDYNLPQFNGLDALQLSIDVNPIIPFIIVTGTLLEESAVDVIKAGAWDYVSKERLDRLPGAINNSLKLKEERAKRIDTENEIKKIKEKTGIQLKLLLQAIEKAPTCVIITSCDGSIQYVNPIFEKLTGYTRNEVTGKNPRILKSGQHNNELYKELWTTILEGKEWKGELLNKKKNGDLYWSEVSISPIIDEDNKILHFISVEHDISNTKKYEQALKESENWYKGIFGNTGTATAILEPDETISLVNSKFEELTGYSKNEIEGQFKWKEFIAPADVERMRDFHFQRRTAGENQLPNVYEFSLVNRNNEIRNILLTVDLIPGTNKSVAALLDITERKQIERSLKASEEKFRLISNSAHDGILMINNNNKVIYWNPAIEKIFEYLGEELVGIDINKLFNSPSGVNQDYLPINVEEIPFSPLASGKSIELEIEKRDGIIIEIELSIAPYKNVDQWGAVCVVRDITERKIAERELIIAKERAEESDRLKSAFLATMSHELRTPLNAVIGFSSLIDETMEIPVIMEMNKIIYNSGNHLLSIIDSVFNLALLQAKVSRIYLEEFNLSDFIESLIPYLKTKINNEKKEHIKIINDSFNSEKPVIIKSDKTKLMQVMVNLFDNAIKYTEEGSIEYGCTLDNNSIIFYVKDTGIGIPKDKQSIVFERFRQIEDSITREHGGVGLGLSICLEIAELLNGKIWFESEVDSGSIFYFKLNDAIISN
ncbi:MAG: PAS domain S-box protein [Prolixibacteraceae bacterium]|nr:PAS domain S-box protein [Prolixibacteraceae bacterium]